MVNPELKSVHARLVKEVEALDVQLEKLASERAAKVEAIAHLAPAVAEVAEIAQPEPKKK
jgi:hypothetical protein